jgi:hypothetical protein
VIKGRITPAYNLPKALIVGMMTRSGFGGGLGKG